VAVHSHISAIESILERFSTQLGRDRAAYTNHVLRVANFFAALGGVEACPDQVLVAAAFHDLGIWTAGTFDYLGPSVEVARAHLDRAGLGHLGDEVEAIIVQHHRLRTYRGPFQSTVEAFRRADLVDVSLGAVRFGLGRGFVGSVRAALPNEGFHRRLVALTLRQTARQPWRPLPMMRW
jgi:hypothetical protein